MLLGKGYTWTLEDDIHSLREYVKILTAPHPGAQGLIPWNGLSHKELIDWLRDELETAKSYAKEERWEESQSYTR